MAVIAESQGKLGFPFYFPALRKTGSRYADAEPRIYTHPRRPEQAAQAPTGSCSTRARTASTTASRG